MKILIIEDERKLARFIKQGLEQNGHVADLSHSGSVGLDHLAGGLYDLVLLDLMLPEQSGFDVMVTSDQNIRYQQNLSGRKLALVVLGSNIWPVVRRHGTAIAASIGAATQGSYAFIEMPHPPKPLRTAQ